MVKINNIVETLREKLKYLKLNVKKNNISGVGLAKAIELAKEKGIRVLLVGMKIPKNYGKDYRQKFEAMYPRLAKNHKVPLMPFLLDGVGGVKDLNLPDGIHPNEKGYKVVAEKVFPFIEKLL